MLENLTNQRKIGILLVLTVSLTILLLLQIYSDASDVGDAALRSRAELASTMGVVLRGRKTDLRKSSLENRGSFSLKTDLTGKISLVNFWASWCDVCESERSYLERLYSLFGEQVQFIGIATNDSLESIALSKKADNISYKIVLDEGGDIFRYFGGSALPNTFIVDRAGHVTLVIRSAINPESEDRLRKEIDRLVSLH